MKEKRFLQETKENLQKPLDFLRENEYYGIECAAFCA